MDYKSIFDQNFGLRPALRQEELFCKACPIQDMTGLNYYGIHAIFSNVLGSLSSFMDCRFNQFIILITILVARDGRANSTRNIAAGKLLGNSSNSQKNLFWTASKVNSFFFTFTPRWTATYSVKTHLLMLLNLFQQV